MGKFFVELQEDVDELRNNIEKILLAIENAKKLLSHFEKNKKEAEELLLNKKELERRILDETIEILTRECLSIFFQEGRKAIVNSEEFNNSIFFTAFENTIYNTYNLIKITVISRGNLEVKINVDELGTLEDYVNGVLFARKIVKSKKKVSSKIASLFWKNIIYGDSGGPLYDMTVELRLKHFKDKIPFWVILNYGTPPNLKSDLTPQGTAYPVTLPTFFVEKSEIRIKKLIDESYKSARERARKMLEDIPKQWQDRIDNVLYDIDLLLKLLSELIDPEKLKKAIEKFNNSLKRQSEMGARAKKIQELFFNLIKGSPVKERVYLGFGQRKRTTTLVREINKILERE